MTFITFTNASQPSTTQAGAASDSVLQASIIPQSSSSATLSGSNSSSRQTLIVALAVVLGVVGITLVGVVVFLLRRYGGSHLLFYPRGPSPINDDEIESWRGTDREQKLTIPPRAYRPAIREVSAVPVNSPEWPWTAAPSSIRTPSEHFSDCQVQAQSPNARVGLTDEVVPGDDPFIVPPKRQSSRLSKLHPGHSRSKSRRSSMSNKSLWSLDRTSNDFKYPEHPISNWSALDDAAAGFHFRAEPSSKAPQTSTIGEPVTGGLSLPLERRTRALAQAVSREEMRGAIA